MNSKHIIYYLFIVFGLIAVIYPKEITLEEKKQSFKTEDLTRGWGIYSITIGFLLLFPTCKITIIRYCFISSIVWRLFIIYNFELTQHHTHSIIINLLVLFLTFIQ